MSSKQKKATQHLSSQSNYRLPRNVQEVQLSQTLEQNSSKKKIRKSDILRFQVWSKPPFLEGKDKKPLDPIRQETEQI